MNTGSTGEETIYSAGIDIGTSTTQLIFSQITVKTMGGFGKIPKTEIISKEILYRSNISFTPLASADQIDGAEVKKIIEREYRLAGIRPEQLATGAVIITGESSRKKNAKEVAESLAEIAGNFVVAVAGPDLESVLAGKGAGAAALSKETGKIVANLDIGGGTTNICYFKDGEVYDTACLDIGGRLLRLAQGKITYLAEKLKILIAAHNLAIREGDPINPDSLHRLSDVMADILAESVGLREKTAILDRMKTNRLISVPDRPDIITFSGGVASCMENRYADFEFDDLGVLLAQAIKRQPDFLKMDTAQPLETMRATVIGAGNYSMDISGSTIEYTAHDFPMKNLPVAKIKLETDLDIPAIACDMDKVSMLFKEKDEKNVQLALAFKGLPCPSFKQIQEIADHIMKKYDELFEPAIKVILIIEADIGKALGQALKRINPQKRDIICIDGISVSSGDYIDLGQPIAGGAVIPVIVKTLVFNG
ncbi:MAG: ethanolamine ammonia-lyase reactivating factor EutA [Oscillospiraceae bacterium]